MKRRNFVDDLVGFTDRLLVALWPAPAAIPQGNVISANRSLIPLRGYIEFILRRSRTTCSTLLAALYYLTLLPPSVLRQNFATDQLGDTERDRPLQCQRRMFLAALILAWKYTQERSYSSRTWAQISGLSSKEINANEVVFLSTVDWRLHIPDTFFRRWTAEVLYYAKLRDRALPDSLLSCVKEGRDWPFRLLLLESRCGHLDSRECSARKLPVSCLIQSSDLPCYITPHPGQHICHPRSQPSPSSQSSPPSSA
ncbi:hypothetical protein DL95DRAFT_186550 [Leptodontidium sp. 2 PMI_412]|nr:hypothetical protein DL95DRAFT_186550 [Leptodontidium sp. 2 PMI_412]